MLSESNKIIIVDDTKEHLDKLSAAFHNIGLGCKSLEYDALYSDPLKGIRIAFFDVNLCNSTNDTERNSKLCQALRDYIALDNGAYILFFWTSDTKWIDSFLAYINERNEENISVPYYIGTINKEDVLNSPERLKEELHNIFELPSVKLAFEYENIIAESIHNTISNIIGTVPFSGWAKTNEFEQNCKKVFSSIAVQHYGKNAKDYPDKAIKEALIPICMSSFVDNNDDFWKKYLKVNSSSRFPQGYQVSKLNNIFNLDISNDVKRINRGAFCVLRRSDTEKLLSFDFSQLLLCTLPLSDDNDKEYAEKSEEIKEHYTKDSVLICVEFSSACDYTWNKARTNKYLLGVMVPSKYAKYLSRNKPDFCLSLNDVCFHINNNEYFLCFNLNYTFTISEENNVIIEKIIGQFRKEFMDMIGNRYANHISRIGITSFR